MTDYDEPTTETAISNDAADGNDNVYPYTPTFSEKVRTAIYIVCLVASIVGLGFMSFGDAAIGGFISTAAGILAAGTGTAFNPIGLNSHK